MQMSMYVPHKRERQALRTRLDWQNAGVSAQVTLGTHVKETSPRQSPCRRGRAGRSCVRLLPPAAVMHYVALRVLLAAACCAPVVSPARLRRRERKERKTGRGLEGDRRADMSNNTPPSKTEQNIQQQSELNKGGSITPVTHPPITASCGSISRYTRLTSVRYNCCSVLRPVSVLHGFACYSFFFFFFFQNAKKRHTLGEQRQQLGCEHLRAVGLLQACPRTHGCGDMFQGDCSLGSMTSAFGPGRFSHFSHSPRREEIRSALCCYKT